MRTHKDYINGRRVYESRPLLGPLRGMRLATPVPDRAALAIGTYERHVVNMLRRHLKPGVVAYDAGAHMGYLSLVMAQRCRQVVAFEPDPANAECLQQNAARNGITNVDLVQAAVTSEDGALEFATFGFSLVNHLVRDHEGELPIDAHVITVPTTTIDSHAESTGLYPSLIKVDVEGGEIGVIEGALGVIDKIRPAIVCEVRPDSLVSIRELLRPFGYRGRAHGGLRALHKRHVGEAEFVPKLELIEVG